MHKGIFFIPVNDQNKKPDSLFDEVIEQTINAENWGLAEAFFGEHITDRHEKITSSLMMISTHVSKAQPRRDANSIPSLHAAPGRNNWGSLCTCLLHPGKRLCNWSKY